MCSAADRNKCLLRAAPSGLVGETVGAGVPDICWLFLYPAAYMKRPLRPGKGWVGEVER